MTSGRTAFAVSATCSVASIPMVAIWAQTAFGAMASTTLPSSITDSMAAGVGSIVMTTSA